MVSFDNDCDDLGSSLPSPSSVKEIAIAREEGKIDHAKVLVKMSPKRF